MRSYFTIILSLISLSTLNAQILINEVMQSNVDCVMDTLNEFPDSWVELYNNGASSVNMEDYLLGTQPDGSDLWQLPSGMLPSGQLAMIYCDKENTGNHASFRLDSGKGSHVYLYHKDGSIADSIFLEKKQPAPNISYGRLTEGSDTWGYQQTPTPAKANCGTICTEILPDPIFSEPGRVFTSSASIELSITMPEGAPEGTVIRCTTDGTEPTETSLVFTTPIRISNTRVLRAKPFCPGYLSPRSTTQSYLFLDRDMTLPVVSIVTDGKYFTDSKIGIYVDGSYSSSCKNYEYDWRRPINFEYFTEPDSTSRLNQLCETRVSGAASRSSQLKSLALYANKRFGEKHFKYEFFPEQRPGDKKFKSIVLRNAGNDFDYLYMRDALCQRVMSSHVDLDWQAWQPAIFFLNGTYKGILNVRERANENNIYTHYDGLEDIDLIENWWELKAGTWDNLSAFQTFYGEHGHTYAEYEEWMDINEFINLMIMDLYFNNFDFPANNIVLWRPREEGGRWRFIAKDVDYTMGLYGMSSTYQIFQWFYNNGYDSGHAWGNTYDATRLFRRLMEDGDFNREFIDRFAIYMGDFLNFSGILKVWTPMYDKIKKEYPKHRKLINQWWPNYNTELSNAQIWVKERTSSIYSQLHDYYALGDVTSLSINKGLAEDSLSGIAITFNGIPLSSGKFDGSFFAGRDVTLQADVTSDQVPDRTVTGWTLMQGSSVKQIEGNVCEFTMTSSSTQVIALFGTSGIEKIQQDDEKTDAPIYDLNGRFMGRDASKLPKGIYIRKTRQDSQPKEDVFIISN